jgi:Protein of unknown function (DUF2490)
MKLIIISAGANIRRSFNYFLMTCVLLLIFSMLLPNVTTAQEEIHSEYRVTLVPTYPVSKKVFLTTYLGYVNIPSSNTVNYYLGAPLLVTYRPTPVVEFMAGAFLVFANTDGGDDYTELRPLAGVKLYLPNNHHLNIFNWTRYEFRSFYYDDKSLNNAKNRIRNRIGIEFPLSKNAWAPKTCYGFTDFEMFFTVEKGYFDRFRERLGFGYVIDKHWKVELIYHMQLLKESEDHNPKWTDNIFRLNIKWSIPHKIHGPIPHHHDVDD